MKKILIVLFLLTCIFSLEGCSGSNSNSFIPGELLGSYDGVLGVGSSRGVG